MIGNAMDENAVLALAYMFTPDDVEAYASMYPQCSDFRESAQVSETLLTRIDASAIPDNNKLLLIGYLAAYALARNDPDIDAKLGMLLQKLGVSQRYLERIRYNLSTSSQRLIPADANPLSLVVQPPELLQQRLTALAQFSFHEGDFRYRKKVTGLMPQEYEHDLDRMCLDILQKTKGLDLLLRAISKHGYERLDTIQHTGSDLRVSSTQLPDVYAMYTEACRTLDMGRIPDVYVQHEPKINAFAAGIENPIVGFTSGCLDAFTYSEQIWIAGHELGHIKSDHNLYRWLARLISGNVLAPLLGTLGTITLGISGPVVFALECALLNWQRMSELTADRAGLLCCQDINAALYALVKIAGIPTKYFSQINIEAFKEQAREFQGFDFSTRDKVAKIMSVMLATHPWTVMRGHELLKWHESGEYQRVLDRLPAANKAGEAKFGRPKDAVLPPPAAEEDENVGARFCPECGSPHSPDTRFCTQCGNKLG